MESSLGIRLLAVDPDIGRFLTDLERAEARGIVVPTHVLERGPLDISMMLTSVGAFAALILDGMLLEQIQLAEHPTLRLFGPGDFISLSMKQRPILCPDPDTHVLAKTRVALLGDEFSHYARYWGGLIAGLHVRLAEQSVRLAAQLAICQLPRVEDRVMAVMWMLAESWGRVTPAGTVLPLRITHEVLGGLIGARRSTVTIALGALAEEGALTRHDGGWLLLAPPATADSSPIDLDAVRLEPSGAPDWTRPPSEPADPDPTDLYDTVERLRDEHRRSRDQFAEQRERLMFGRERRAEARRRRQRAVRRPTAPS